MELEDPADYVCSVKWIKEGNVLAVGNYHGEISLWDVEQMKKMRTMTGHADRVGALCWNEVNNILLPFYALFVSLGSRIQIAQTFGISSMIISPKFQSHSIANFKRHHNFTQFRVFGSQYPMHCEMKKEFYVG